jgi:hypothetical protein
MATNENLEQGNKLTMPAPIAANAGVGPISGDPLVYGRGTSPSFGMACVAETSYTLPSGLVPTGNISVKTVGVFLLPVVGKASVGGASLGFAIGDLVCAAGGTYDAATGCLYGFVLNGDQTNGVKFGIVLDAVVGGTTTTVRVKLRQAAG